MKIFYLLAFSAVKRDLMRRLIKTESVDRRSVVARVKPGGVSDRDA